MEFLAIIPARYDSSRFPGKPLAMIGGKSMIQRVYEQSCQAFEDVYIATDHPDIYTAASDFGARVVMTSNTHPNGTSRVHEAMLKIEALRGVKCKYVINVQGDEPFIAPEQLTQLTRCFNNPETEIATLIKKIEDPEEILDSNTPKVVFTKEQRALYFSRSPIPFCRDKAAEDWGKETPHYKHIGLYGYKREALAEIVSLAPSPLEEAEKLEQLRWLENGMIISLAETSLESFSVDTPADIAMLKDKGLIA
jgi:3-deoxy-manno-octulosonate cytidylyltransferase (CMP-KDO synthetase)